MNDMNAEDLVEFLRGNIKTVLGGLLLLLALGGDAYYFGSVLLPRWSARAELEAGQAQAEAAVNQALQARNSAPDQISAQIAEVEAQLAERAAIFLTAEQANEMLDRLFLYADRSGASIVAIEALPNPENVSTVYEVVAFRVEAIGTSRQLLAFVRSIEESRIPGVLIRNLVLEEVDSQPTLVMEMHFYVSSFAQPGELTAAQPTAITPIPIKAASQPPAVAATQPGISTLDPGPSVTSTPAAPQISTSPPDLTTSAPPCDCSANLYDCRDFPNHPAAQTCYDFCGGAANDVHLLDADLNGIACQSVLQWSSP